MYNFFSGVTAPSIPAQKQPQAESSFPSSATNHRFSASTPLDGTTAHDTSLSFPTAAQCPSLLYAHSGCGGSNLAGAEQEKWVTASQFHSTFPMPDALPLSSSGAQSLHGGVHQPEKQQQHSCTSISQSKESVRNHATPTQGVSSPLPLQEHQSSTCITLKGESLPMQLDNVSYSPFTPTNVGTVLQSPESMHGNQQYYDSASHQRLYSAPNASSIRYPLQVPAASPPQQQQQQRLPTSSNVWAASTPTTAVPASLFGSSSFRSSRTTSPGYSCELSASALPTLSATLPASYVTGAGLTMSNQFQAVNSVMLQPPQSGQPCSSTEHPTMHPIMVVHPTLDRGAAAMSQTSTDAVNASLHCLTGVKPADFSSTTYYLEAMQNDCSVVDNSKQSYPSTIPMASRQPQPPLQQYYLQPTPQQQQWQQLTAEQQPMYSHILTHDRNIGHFVTHATTGSAILQAPSSMRSGAASLASIHSSVARGGRSGACQPPSTADTGSCRAQDSKHQQQQQQQQLNPTNAPRSTTDTRGIARRNRDRAVLFVGQLNYEATEADVSQVFSCYGKPLNVVVLKDKGKVSKKSGAGGMNGGSSATHRKVGGSAFVTYGSTLEADTAIMALHGRYNAKDDDTEDVDKSKYLQVSYGQQTGLISTFGMMHAQRLHASKPENPIPFLAKDHNKGKS